MIKTEDPYLVGAALHGLQDYWSHTYEGYMPPAGHAIDSISAGCIWWSGFSTPCQRPPNMEASLLMALWLRGEITSPTQQALRSKVAHLGGGVAALTTSNLFDVWLREQEGAADTRKAAQWKNTFGYDTDAYYSFTRRDQLMEDDSRMAIAEFFDELGTAGLCNFNYAAYTPPDDAEIIRQLNGASE